MGGDTASARPASAVDYKVEKGQLNGGVASGIGANCRKLRLSRRLDASVAAQEITSSAACLAASHNQLKIPAAAGASEGSERFDWSTIRRSAAGLAAIASAALTAEQREQEWLPASRHAAAASPIELRGRLAAAAGELPV